jgi:hypothetical protein
MNTKENKPQGDNDSQAVIPANSSKEACAQTGDLLPVLAGRQKKGRGARGQQRGSPDHPLIGIVHGMYKKSGVTKLLHELNDDAVITRRMTYPGASIVTDVTGALAPVSIFAASNVRTVCTEFTSYNLRYDLYRVIGFRLHFFPRYNSALAGSLPPHSLLAAVNFEGAGVTTIADLLASSYFKSFSPYRPFTFDAIAANNSDCWLWTGTNNSVASTSDFQISMGSGFQATGTASITFGSYFVEVIAQFSRLS